MNAAPVRSPCLLITAAIVWLAPSSLPAAPNRWITPGDGSWEVATNWSSGFAPTNTDTIFLTNTGPYTVFVNNTTADTDPGAGGWMTNTDLFVGSTVGSPTLLVDFTNAARTFVVGGASSGYTAIGGFANHQGTITLSNGSFSTYALHVADAAGALGNLNVHNGVLTVRDPSVSLATGFNVGAAANSTGHVLITGGTLDHTGGFTVLGAGDGALGTMTISNGLFKTAYEVLGYVGNRRGVLNIYGGTNLSEGGYLSIGNNPGATGTILVAGGTLIATNNITYLGFGSTALGEITLSNGNVNLTTFFMGDSGARGRFNIHGGTSTVHGITYFGGATAGGGQGELHVTDGLARFEQEIRMGALAGSRGDWTISGGTSEVLGTSPLYLGYAAGTTGTVTMTGGVLDVGGTTRLGNNASVGVISISNATLVGRAQVFGGNAGALGVMNLYTGGTNTIVTGTIDIGSNPGGTGIINIAGGAFTVDPAISTTFIGDWGTGIINLSNGLLNLGHTVMGALAGAQGTLNIHDGTARFSGPSTTWILHVGHVSGSTGIVNVTGGQLELFNPTLIGSEGYGELNLSGGTILGSTNSSVTYSIGSSAGSKGIFNVSGGQMLASTNTMFVGSAGNGTLNLSNGLVRVRHMVVASVASATGQVNLFGGSNYVDIGGYDIGSSVGATGRVLVAGGYASAVNGTTTYIGDWGHGFLTVSNGLIELNNVTMGDLAASSGQWDIFGGMGSVYGAFNVANKDGSTGRVMVADSGILEIRSTTSLGTGATGAGSITNRDGGTVRFTGLNNPTITKTATGTFISTNAIVEFKDASAANLFGGITNITLEGNNTLSLNNATNANLGSYTFQNNTPATYASLRMINGGTRWQSTNLTIAGGSSLLASNTTGTVRGNVTNAGTIAVVNSKLTFENRVVIQGTYFSDPSTNTFLDDVTVSQSGSMTGGVGDLFDFKKNLTINSTNQLDFDLSQSGVSFSGGGMHTNAITGKDMGGGPPAWDAAFTLGTNFAYGEFHLGSITDQVCFACGEIPVAPGNALYIGWLDLLGSTNLIANLHAPTTINLYYDATDSRNAYLGGLSYSLTDCDLVNAGGFLMPVIPEPGTMALVIAAGALLFRRKP